MKKRLTINTLALGNLKQRRKQYSVMIIGIILAMVFSSSAILFMAASGETSRESRMQERGKQNAILHVDGFAESDYFDKNGVITDAGFAHIIGYGYTDENEKMLGAPVAWMDEKAQDLSYQIFIDGSYPQKDNEAAIEKKALLRLGYKDAKIGDTIKLSIDVQNGENYLNPITKKYKLCGILSDKRDNVALNSDGGYDTNIPSIFVRQNAYIEGGLEKITAYVLYDTTKLRDVYDTFINEYVRYNMRESDEQEVYCFDSGDIHGKGRYLFNSPDSLIEGGDLYFIIVLVLVFASCVAIINSFNTNLKERKRQIGLLRAVGATKRQIIHIFGREAVIISLITAPISVAVSYGIVRLLLEIINNDAAKMSKSLTVLIISAVVNVFVVLIASFIPLFIASRITPIQAIRNIDNNRKIKTKKVKSKTSFNAPVHIAKRNLMFYKGSRAAVSIMLIITIAFSCLGFSFMSYVDRSFYTLPYDYEIDYMAPDNWGNPYNYKNMLNGLTETEKQEILSMPYVESVNCEKSLACALETEKLDEYLRANFRDALAFEYDLDIAGEETVETQRERILGEFDEQYYTEKERLKIDGDFVPTSINGYDDISKLEGYEYDGKINYSRLDSGEEIVLIAPKRVQYRFKSTKGSSYHYLSYDDDIDKSEFDYEVVIDAQSNYKAGDSITVKIPICNAELDDENEYGNIKLIEKTFKIGAIISPQVAREMQWMHEYDMTLLTTSSAINKIYGYVGYRDIGINALGELDDETDFEITEDLQKYAEKYNAYLDSGYSNRQRQLRDKRNMYVTLIALIIIGFVICASIINNSISARIRENKSVIGTLRAVGASKSDLVMSYVRQMLSMFSVGCIIGYATYAVILLIAYLVCKYFGGELVFHINPWITLVMTALTFAVCAVNIWVKIRKETQNSIVENIREL